MYAAPVSARLERGDYRACLVVLAALAACSLRPAASLWRPSPWQASPQPQLLEAVSLGLAGVACAGAAAARAWRLAACSLCGSGNGPP
eukprot:gene11842-5075_t